VTAAPSPSVTVAPSPSPTAAPSPTATAAPSPTSTAAPSASATAAPTASAAGSPVTIDLIAQNIAFDKKTITVSAGAQVTMNFDNRDSGIPHNFALYTDSSASTPIFVGQIINGPATTTYTFTSPATPGTYYFRCDPHANIMNGQFIVQ
jgi:plastocyanin